MANSPDNLISAAISDKDIAEIQNNLAAIKKKLDFLIQLSPDDKRRLAKPGADALMAAESVAHLIENNSKLIPKEAVDADEMRKDLALIRDLTPLYEVVQGLADNLNDTLLAAKSDVYRNTLKGYAIAQVLARNVSGIDAALASLKGALDRPARIKKNT